MNHCVPEQPVRKVEGKMMYLLSSCSSLSLDKAVLYSFNSLSFLDYIRQTLLAPAGDARASLGPVQPLGQCVVSVNSAQYLVFLSR